MASEEQNIQQLQANLTEMAQDFATLQPFSNKLSSGKSKLSSCDLMIVLDCTGSMGSWIQGCKQQIRSIIDGVKKDFNNSQLRVGMVAYRDHCDVKRIESFPFISKDYGYIETFIGSLSATGGGDEPEDLAGALEAALYQNNWTSESKTLVIITDAPCHGTMYHKCSDTYPDGCPNGIDIEELIFIMGKRGIDLNVIDITSKTKQMYEIFSRIYAEARGQPIVRMNLGQNTLDLGNMIKKSVSATITHTLNSHKTLGGEDDIYKKAFKLLRAHKGLVNTNCLSKTELELSQMTHETKTDQHVINEEADEEEEDSDEEFKDCESKNKEEIDEGITKQELEQQLKIKKEWENIRAVRDFHEEIDPLEKDKETEQQLKKDDKPNPELEIPIPETTQYTKQRELEYTPTSQYDYQKTRPFNFDKNPSFSFSCNCLTPYVNGKQTVDWNNPPIKVQQMTSKVKINRQYFSEGAMRYAFYAFDQTLNQNLVAKLHQKIEDNSDFDLMKRDSMSLIACHFFAEEFNSRLLLRTSEVDESSANKDKSPILLNFVNSSIYQVIGHPNKYIKYYFVENFISGIYQKFNNNAGWTNEASPSVFNEITQAFSHFTWQYSRGQLLVVDIQGGQHGTLTDPQIHTKNRSKLYGSGDLGYEGMMRFFYSHECNSFCKLFGLIDPKKESVIPTQFDFFSELYGLEDQKVAKQKKEAENSKENEKPQESKTEEAKEDENEEEIEQEKQQKKKKKKKGPALKAEMEKLRLLEEQKNNAKEMKLAQENKKIEGTQQQGQPIQEEKVDLREVGVQCCLCKQCFSEKRTKVISNKTNHIDTLCESCEIQCASSQIDLACITCGVLFKISKYYCKAKKINLIGKCPACRD